MFPVKKKVTIGKKTVPGNARIVVMFLTSVGNLLNCQYLTRYSLLPEFENTVGLISIWNAI